MATPSIVVHGGAGAIAREDRAERAAAGCQLAAEAGFAVLEAGGSALEAVLAAAVVLEDDPQFNAGTGASLDQDGRMTHDAMVIDGARRMGGVALLEGFKNPILVARTVLEHTEHILLAGEGAGRFGRAHGALEVPVAELTTELALERWHREKAAGWPRRPGTIGAVAVDRAGHVAAATSTGGLSGKLSGRIGDSPLPGAGTWADDPTGAASATGYGEGIMQVTMARFACDRLAAGRSARDAAADAVAELGRIDGEGGIILVDRLGRVGMAFNSARMSRAWITGDGDRGAGFDP